MTKRASPGSPSLMRSTPSGRLAIWACRAIVRRWRALHFENSLTSAKRSASSRFGPICPPACAAQTSKCTLRVINSFTLMTKSTKREERRAALGTLRGPEAVVGHRGGVGRVAVERAVWRRRARQAVTRRLRRSRVRVGPNGRGGGQGVPELGPVRLRDPCDREARNRQQSRRARRRARPHRAFASYGRGAHVLF